MKGLSIKSLQLQNFMSVGNVMQTIVFDNNVMRVITGEDLDAPKLKRSGIGKAQPLYSKVRTPTGWKKIGKLGVGDSVCAPNGTTTIVSGVYPQGKRLTYVVTLEDGRKAEACSEHLWKTYSDQGVESVISTKQIMEMMKEDTNVSLPVMDELLEATYYKDCVDPYFIGLFLVANTQDKDYITFNTFDENIYSTINRKLTLDQSIIRTNDGLTIMESGMELYNKLYAFTNLDVRDIILNQMSVAQRKDVLRGIFDIHGNDHDNDIQCVFTQSQADIARLTRDIVWSLGGWGKIKKNILADELSHIDAEYILTSRFHDNNLYFNSFDKKVFGFNNQLVNKVLSIKEKQEEECVCISVLSSESLYVTDNYVVTHNTTLQNGLAYVLYNKPVSEIKLSLLPNKVNVKSMFVRCDFHKDGKDYYIERGIKPEIFKFVEYADDKEVEISETLGTKADTQAKIQSLLGMSHDLFTMIVTINTMKPSYMKCGLAKQRDIIEEILNIGELTRKAKILSEYKIKTSKLEIEKEKVRIESMKNMQDKATSNYQYQERQYNQWEYNNKNEIDSLYTRAKTLLEIDIDKELGFHHTNQTYKDVRSQKAQIRNEKNSLQSMVQQGTRRLTEINTMLASFTENKCPTCKQTIDDESHKDQQVQLKNEAVEYFEVLDSANAKLETLDAKLNGIEDVTYNDTYYQTLQEAYTHQQKLMSVNEKIEASTVASNPYTDSLHEAKKMLDDSQLDYTHLEYLEKVLAHQLFLQKILTGRDSFVRKRIIDVSIPMLNQRIDHYLRKSDLTHEIKFESDLNLSIFSRGSEYNFDQLSRGEQNWAIISLNLAMRDLFEEIHGTCNVVFVDELIDYGIDATQSVDAFNILKGLAKERNKSVSLITHREELFEKADEILYTLKENDFTTYETRTN